MSNLPLRASSPTQPAIGDATRIHGMQRIMTMVYHGADTGPLISELSRRIEADEHAPAAMLDLSLVLQSLSRPIEARRLLDAAMRLQRDYCVVHGDGSGPHILAFVAPGDFMTNTPMDLLLNGTNAVLWLRYVNGETADLDNPPQHDVAFLAVAEGNDNGPALARLRHLLAEWPGPVMNNRPDFIDSLTRDEVSRLLADVPTIVSPPTRRIARTLLAAVAAGEATLADAADGLTYPIIVRPVGTHAGCGLERVAHDGDLSAYLETETAARFYLAPFIDYRGADGLFAKQRVAFIKGRPYASHMALSDHWMVHYLNAGMADSAAKRATEQDWMERFDTDFAVRHAASLAALATVFDLDYFGIDCAELPDGRLLVFELSVAMGVHDMDDEATFPYKKVAMRKLFDAFVASAVARA